MDAENDHALLSLADTEPVRLEPVAETGSQEPPRSCETAAQPPGGRF